MVHCGTYENKTRQRCRLFRSLYIMICKYLLKHAKAQDGYTFGARTILPFFCDLQMASISNSGRLRCRTSRKWEI